ncbi:Ionotropic receptor 571 [Blattella germanica]|nr:Ionotropic receptor 571 [Blattella germanica]
MVSKKNIGLQSRILNKSTEKDRAIIEYSPIINNIKLDLIVESRLYTNFLSNVSMIDQQIIKCITSVVNTHFPKFKTVVVISEKDCALGQEVLSSLHLLSEWSIISTSGSNMKLRRRHGLRQACGFIFLLDTDEYLRNLLLELESHPVWNSRARFVVAISAEVKSNTEKIIYGILNDFWQRYVINLVVLQPLKENMTVQIHTWYPFTKTRCRGPVNESEIIDQWIPEGGGRFLTNAPLFPNKIKNLHQCNIIVGTRPFEPYVLHSGMFNCSKTESSPCYKSGLEISILQTLSKSINFQLKYLDPPKGDWIEISEYTLNKTSDIAISAFSRSGKLTVNFDCSVTYIQDNIVWFTPRGKRRSPWENLILIFSQLIWVLLSLSFVLFSVVTWQLAKLETNEHPCYQSAVHSFLNALVVLLGLTVKLLPKTTVLMALVYTWILFSLNIRTAYQSSLISFLTNPRFHEPIRNVEELLNSGIKYGFYPGIRSWFDDPNDPKMNEIFKNYIKCYDNIKCLNRMAYQRDFAVAGGKFNKMYLAAKHFTRSGKMLYLPMKINISFIYICMMFQKGSVFLDRFNEVIGRIITGGFIGHWWEEIKSKNLEPEIVNHANEYDDDDDHFQVLNFVHLRGSFLLYTIGLSVAIIVFLLELVCNSFYRGNSRNKMEG